MKNSILKFSLAVFLSIVLIGCSSDEPDIQIVETVGQEEAKRTAQVDNATEVISDTFVQVYEAEEYMGKSRIHPFLPECVVVTVKITNESKTIVVDFGSKGCEVRGHLIKGKVMMSYEVDIESKVLVINYLLENFFIDEVQFEGSKTITRQRINEEGNPQYMMDLNLAVTFADGTEAIRTGTKTREWIEGAFNGNWGDNVFLITGAWQTNFANGNMHSTTITTPLRREASCKFLVSGVVDLVRTNYNGTLDYGNGTCDNKAVFTNTNGEEREILL